MNSDGTVYQFGGIMMRMANDVKEFWFGEFAALGQSDKIVLGAWFPIFSQYPIPARSSLIINRKCIISSLQYSVLAKEALSLTLGKMVTLPQAPPIKEEKLAGED